MDTIMAFISANKMMVVATVAFFVVYAAKRFIAYKAADPEVNVYDTLKPGSELMFELAFRAVEAYALKNPISPVAKLTMFINRIEEFEREWDVDRVKAIQKFIAFYLSMKQKVESTSANPLESAIDKDSVAVE